MFEYRSIGRGHTGLLLVVTALTCLAVIAQDAPVTEAVRNPAQVLLFHQHPEDYKGGRQVAVTVHISASTWDGLTAMGLYETVPEGWTFAGARAIGGAMPGVTPKNGDTGLLQFLWIEQSTAPITFQYLLNVPPRESGVRYFSGQVEYRHGEGALVSNVALSQVNGVADAPPVITLLGEAALTLALNASFSDPGASATDPEDGDLSGQIQVSGAVDTTASGTYTLVYSVTDSVGNPATPATRAVTVSENPSESPNPAPGDGRPDTPGRGTLEGDSTPEMPTHLAKASSEEARNFPPIVIPTVNLHKNKGDEDFTLESSEAGNGKNAEDATAGEGGGTDHTSPMAQADGRGRRAIGKDPDAASFLYGANDGRSAEDVSATRPTVLIAVALALGAALVALWRRPRSLSRRPPRSSV